MKSFFSKFFNSFRKYFIPHAENDHAPHFLRTKTILVIVAFLLVVEGVFVFGKYVVVPDSNFFALISSNVIVSKTNDSRAEGKLQLLVVSPTLELAARLKAEDMASKSYFAHTSPEGLNPWHWFREAGYKFSYAGENLAINFSDSEDLVKAWLDSPSHRANILNSHFTEIGIATARGVYNGRETVFVVEMFGRPTPKVALAEKLVDQPKLPVVVQAPPVIPKAPEQTFVAVRGVETGDGVLAEEEIPVSPAAPLAGVSWVEKVIASPRAALNYIFYLVGAFVALALALKVFIKIRIQHPRLIANAFIVLVILAVFVFLNEHLSLSFAKVL